VSERERDCVCVRERVNVCMRVFFVCEIEREREKKMSDENILRKISPHFFEPRQASNCLPRSNIEVDTDQRKASLIFYY